MKTLRFNRWKFLVIALSAGITTAMIVYELIKYPLAPSILGLHTVAKLMLLSIFFALLGRALLVYILRTERPRGEASSRRVPGLWRPVFFLDLNAPIYLAVGVLTNVPAAVLTAIITQILLQFYTAFTRLVSWTEAWYRIASTALLVYATCKIYKLIAGPPHENGAVFYLVQPKEFFAATVSAVIMLLLIVLIFAPLLTRLNRKFKYAPWGTYVLGPILFQGLILSIGPLLPIMGAIGQGVSELAWLLFLGPLFAIYYLALMSTRMGLKAYELEQTLEELQNTRRRRDELSNYASLITRAQEDERRRLARDLHDDTAQSLIALSLGLDGLLSAMEKLRAPEKVVQWLQHLRNMVNDTLEGVRRACQNLRPSVLDNLGLRAAMEWLTNSSATRGIACEFACLGKPHPLTPEIEIALYRIVQEALSNIWKHSFANRASVELCYMPKLLCVIIRDNGKGFFLNPEQSSDQPGASAPKSMGLVGMRERALLIGATLTVSTFPGQGCTISLYLPLS